MDVSSLLGRYRAMIDTGMRAAIPDGADADDFYGMQRYHLGWADEHLRPVQARSGKRLRPSLCLLCCEAAGGTAQSALPTAVALELIHNFSLLHDDVEDRGAERWGRPTVWARWGEPRAINAGDAMLILAELALIGAEAALGAAETLVQLRLINECCLRLTEGQHLDMSLEGNPALSRAQYFKIIERKTAALLGSACELGARSGGARGARATAFGEFGFELGIAFQIQDDLLGIWGDPTVTGKPAAADIDGHKVTLPVIVAIERAAPEMAARISAVYSSRAPTPADIRETLGYFAQLGVRETAEAEATQAIDRALRALHTASPSAPFGDELEALARSLLGRVA